MPQNREKCKRERENKTTAPLTKLPVIAKPVRTLAVAIRSPLDLHRGITDSHDQSADWSRNDTQILSASVIAKPVRTLAVGSEPSAASGRRSEVSEWPRSKF